MSRSEVVVRRLTRTFLPVEDVRKTDKMSRYSDADPVTYEEEE